MIARTGSLLVTVAALAALTSCSKSDTPTEPSASGSPSLTLAMTQLPVASPSGGFVSVFNDACGCATLDSFAIHDPGGTSSTWGGSTVFACGSTAPLPLKAVGPSITLTAYGHTAVGQPVSSSLGISYPSGYSGPVSFAVRIGCSSH
jgi:hypothetical protein